MDEKELANFYSNITEMTNLHNKNKNNCSI